MKMNTNTMISIIKKNDLFSSIEIDQVIFDGPYPILFIVKQNNNLYLFICHSFENCNIQWIATNITPDTIINLLINNISFREAFLNNSNKKYILSYDGKTVTCSIVDAKCVPENYLPPKNEYLDAENGEYEDLIQYYSECIIRQICIRSASITRRRKKRATVDARYRKRINPRKHDINTKKRTASRSIKSSQEVAYLHSKLKAHEK